MSRDSSLLLAWARPEMPHSLEAGIVVALWNQVSSWKVSALAPVLQLRQLMSNDMQIVYEDVAYRARVPVKVVSVGIYPRLVTLMSIETDPAPGRKPEAFICLYPRDSEPAERTKNAQPDDTGVLIFTDYEGHGFWNYFPDDAAAVRAEKVVLLREPGLISNA